MAKGLTGGQLIAKMLAAEGVDHLFGIIDGTYFGLYRALADEGITLHSPRHESAAAHMAGAYARVSGRLGVCMASNGPGVANVLPGVAVEQGEGNRILLITSGRRVGITHPDRGGTYQNFDQTAVTAPMTKWSCHVPSADRIPEILRRALRVSFSGRPGVVHVDVPENIINQPTGLEADAVRAPESYRRTTPLQPDPVLVERAAQLLVDAESPMIHVGSGVYHAGAEAELARLAGLLAAPVTTSWAARGALSETRPEAIPMTALAVNDEVRNAADVALVVGSRLGETDWWGKAPNWAPPARQKTIQVDVDDERLGVNKPVSVAILADAREALRALADAVERLSVPGLAARREPARGVPRQGGRRAGQARQGARTGGSGAPRSRADGGAAGDARGHRVGLRRRQHRRVVQLLPLRRRAADGPVDVQVRHARGGHGPGPRGGRRRARPAGLRAHRRRRLRHAPHRGRERGAPRPARSSSSSSSTAPGGW